MNIAGGSNCSPHRCHGGVAFVILMFCWSAGAANALDVAREVNLASIAHSAALQGDNVGADDILTESGKLEQQAGASAILARRAASVCAWLRNDNEYGRAARLAERMIGRLSALTETNDADRVERLYWEACLEGNILDHKARALELLREAEKLAPDDPRILEDELRWAQALAEFGK